MSGSIPQHLQGIARQAEKRGWKITTAGGGHLKWQPPPGWHPPKVVFTAKTPGRGRSHQNTMAKLRKAGLLDNGKSSR